MDETYSFSELCGAIGKGAFYIKSLQRSLGLPAARHGKPYREEYLRLLEKAVSLRAFSVAMEKIVELFETEKKILRLLHIDSLSRSDTWYLDACCSQSQFPQCLLLTGYDLGFPISADGWGDVQHHLDFSERDPELFSGAEMGEDVRLVLDKYAGLVGEIEARIEQETPVLRDALAWAGEVFPRRRRPRNVSRQRGKP